MKTAIAVLSTILFMTLIATCARADRTLPLRIIGTDAACSGYTPGADANGNTATCVPMNNPPAPGAPTGCVATVNGVANLTLGSGGGAVNLAASCATPSSGIGYVWSRNGTAGASSAASWTDTRPANVSTTTDVTTSYQVRACVVAACVTVPISPLTVTVPHVGGGGFTGTCPGFDNTFILDFTWSAPNRQTANMGSNDIVIGRFTTGNIASANNNLPRISGAEFGSPPSGRYGVLSASPCDFSAQTWQGAITAGNSVQVPFAVTPGSNWNFYPLLQKNTTYYFNVRNLDGQQSCKVQGVCTYFLELSVPNDIR